MAIKIPLNRFRSRFIPLTVAAGFSGIYSPPDRRASIIVIAQVSNSTFADRTLTVSVCSNQVEYPLVSNFPVPAQDARSLVTGRLVLQGVDNDTVFSPDILVARDTTTTGGTSGLTISLGILETVNVE
jgi:hypothetical protein